MGRHYRQKESTTTWMNPRLNTKYHTTLDQSSDLVFMGQSSYTSTFMEKLSQRARMYIPSGLLKTEHSDYDG